MIRAAMFSLVLLTLSGGATRAASLARPATSSGLPAIPTADIQRAERAAWSRDYNNFVEAADLCYDRAVDVAAELGAIEAQQPSAVPLHQGSEWDLSQSNIAKMFLVFPYRYQVQASDGSWVPTTRWLYHIATAARGDDGEWHPIDPDASGRSPETPEAWVQRYAWDAWQRPLAATRSAAGTYYADLPPAGQVYFYWLPADYYQPGYDSSLTSLAIFYRRDPIAGWAQSIAALRAYRAQMQASQPGARLSSVDLLRWSAGLTHWAALTASIVSHLPMPGTPAAP